MKLPRSAHTSRPWRIHDLTRDFRVEDVWALPTQGGRDDFGRLVQWFVSRDDPARSSGSAAARALWAIRSAAGKVLGWDSQEAGVGTRVRTLRDRRSGEVYLTLIEGVLGGADSIAEGVRDFFLGAGEHLVRTNYADACPIATIALEVASTDNELRRATAEVFGSWVAAAARHLERGGVSAAEAGPLAMFALAALEGAFVLCRAHRSTDAIESAAAYVQRAVQDAVSRAATNGCGTTAPEGSRSVWGEQADVAGDREPEGNRR